MALKLGTLTVDFDSNTAGLKKGQKEVQKSAKATTAAFKKAGAAIAAAISIEAARRVILLADNMRVLERRLVRFTGSAASAEKTFNALAKTASNVGATIQDTTQIFERFSLIREDIGATNQQILEMTDTLAKLGAIGGSSQQEMANGLRQLSQGLAGGILRAEEFNSIIENTPEIGKTIGREMGLSMGEFRKAVLAGEVTSVKVFEAIQAASERANKEFEEMPKSITMIAQALQNELAIAVKNLDEGLGVSDFIVDRLTIIKEIVQDFNRETKESHRLALETAKQYDELGKLNKERLKVTERINELEQMGGFSGLFAGGDLSRGKKRLEGINDEIAKLRASIKAGEAATEAARLAEAPQEEELLKKIDVAPTISKADQARIDKIKLLGESERQEIERIANERKAFILEQDQLEADERLGLLVKTEGERLSKLEEIAQRERDIENQKNEEIREKRREALDQQIAAVNMASNAISNLLKVAGNEQAARAAAVIDGVASLATTIATISALSAKAQALSDPSATTTAQKVANVAIMAGQFAGIFAALKGAKGGGRQFGGSTSGSMAHPINEAGIPEILEQGGKQFLLPTGKGGNISPLEKAGNGQANVTIISNGTPQTIEGTQVSRGEIAIMINDAGRQTKREINASLASGRGDTARSLQSGFKTERNIR